MTSSPKISDKTGNPEAIHLPRSTAEWVSLLITSVLLTTVVGLVSYLWISDRNEQPPVLELLKAGEPRQVSEQYYVPFVVTNTGGETAETVQIIAELRIGNRVIESGEQQIDFLSRREKVEGAFIFTQNPEQGDVVIRVASYKLP